MIEGYGAVEPIPNATFHLDRGIDYRVVFDCRTAATADDGVNPGLDRIARFLNLLEQDGIPPGRAKLAAVFHSEPTKATLSDAAYRRRLGASNPNSELIGLLKEQGVELLVCGQSVVSRGFGLDEADSRFVMAVSSMSALAVYQLRGFALLLE
jgi:intracellular sulfur oxidation DsrE/DsrF family protein